MGEAFGVDLLQAGNRRIAGHRAATGIEDPGPVFGDSNLIGIQLVAVAGPGCLEWFEWDKGNLGKPNHSIWVDEIR